MNLFPDQIAAAGARQLDAQLQFLRSAAGNAIDGAEQLAALQFATTRGVLDTSTDMLRQVAAARDPRDLFALSKHAKTQFDSMMAYQSKLFGIANAMTGAVAGLQRAVTPAAGAALQKLAALPPVANVASGIDRIIETTCDVVEELADDSAYVAAAAAPLTAPPGANEDNEANDANDDSPDIIDQTNELIEQIAAGADHALEAPTAEPHGAPAAEPIAELTAVAAAAGHHAPQPSAAPFTVASTDTPIEVEQVEPVDATAPVNVTKSTGRPRKK